jgi:hypothetical protein
MAPDPFRRPPAIDIPWGERERWWQRTTQRLTGGSLWDKAESLADLGELSAQFCEGKLLQTPDHGGTREPETVGIAAPLAHANRQGFVTGCSQPGYDQLFGEGRAQQRAAVEGWAAPDTVRKLRNLVRGTRLQIQVAESRPRRTDYSAAVNVSRHVGPEKTRECTSFGAVPGRREHFADLGRPDLTEGACYVTIYDPEWGPQSLLWDRLGQRDWDNPAPPEPETAMPIPSEAEVRDAEREADRLARKGAPAAEIDAADEEYERRHQAYVAAGGLLGGWCSDVFRLR